MIGNKLARVKHFCLQTKQIYNHLKNYNFDVNKVSRIETKYDYYRCFVIECTDLEFEDLINSNIWHVNTKIKEFIGDIDPVKVKERDVFPKK